MENYKKIYKNMLEEASKMRRAFIAEYGDVLAFGGDMPSDAKSDLQASAKITGIVFDALARHGVELGASSAKPGFYEIVLDGTAYSCHGSTIPSLSGAQEAVPTPAPVTVPLEELEQHSKFEDEVEEEEEEERLAPAFEEEEPELDADDDANEPEFEEDDEPQALPEPEEGDEELPEDNVAAAFLQKRAEVIGATKVVPMMPTDVFVEEKTKAVPEIVYEMFDITVAHSGYGGGGRAEEMRVVIAPLKIVRQATPSVPILVSVLHRGRVYTKSSYDVTEEGKNLVTLDVAEFYLLCRGSFDANGVFHALMTTTGISANQGDILNVNSLKSFGTEAGRNVRNGHVKFRYTSDHGPGTVEVFPADAPGVEEFIVMTKNDEFTDYLYVSNSRGRTSKRALVFDNDVKKEVVCSWGADGETLTADLVEV